MVFQFLLFCLSVSLAAENEFSEADFKRILTQSSANVGTTYVIYSWSPHMSLSVKGLEELTAEGDKSDLVPIAILDPDANLDLAKEIVRQRKWPSEFLKINRAETLLKRGTRIHYPSYNFVSRGALRGRLLPGYKTREELKSFRKRLLK